MWLFSTAYGLGDKKITGHLPTKYTKKLFSQQLLLYIQNTLSIYKGRGIYIDGRVSKYKRHVYSE